MAKETRLIVRVPGEFNEELARYMFWLQDMGIHKTKAQVIIELAREGYKPTKAMFENKNHTEGPFGYK